MSKQYDQSMSMASTMSIIPTISMITIEEDDPVRSLSELYDCSM